MCFLFSLTLLIASGSSPDSMHSTKQPGWRSHKCDVTLVSLLWQILLSCLNEDDKCVGKTIHLYLCQLVALRSDHIDYRPQVTNWSDVNPKLPSSRAGARLSCPSIFPLSIGFDGSGRRMMGTLLQSMMSRTPLILVVSNQARIQEKPGSSATLLCKCASYIYSRTLFLT